MAINYSLLIVLAVAIACDPQPKRDQGELVDPDLSNAALIPELQQYLEDGNSVRLPTSEIIDLEMRVRDIEFLAKALLGSYSGYVLAEQEGFSWSDAFSNLRKVEGSIKPEDWLRLVKEAFSGLSDQHLALMTIDHDGKFKDWTPIVERIGIRYELDRNCTSGESPLAEAYYEDGQSSLGRRVTAVTNQTQEISGCKWTVIENSRRSRESIPSVKELSPSAYIVRVHNFAIQDSATWENFRATANNLRSAATIAIDMRGNVGGDDHQFYRWLCDLLGYRPKTVRFDQLQSPWVHLNLVNYFTRQIAFGAGDESLQQHVRKYRKIYLNLLSEVEPAELEKQSWDTWDRAETEPPPDAATSFDGRIVVLVDRHCSSACELALKTLKGLSNATIAGENTYGMARHGENGPKRLPGSGLAFQWGHWIEMDLRDGFGGFREGEGFKPDIWLAPGSAESDEAILSFLNVIVADQQGSLFLRTQKLHDF